MSEYFVKLALAGETSTKGGFLLVLLMPKYDRNWIIESHCTELLVYQLSLVSFQIQRLSLIEDISTLWCHS